jgi:hypothetical protein
MGWLHPASPNPSRILYPAIAACKTAHATYGSSECVLAQEQVARALLTMAREDDAPQVVRIMPGAQRDVLLVLREF